MKCCHAFFALFLPCCLTTRVVSADKNKNLGIQLAENPPVQTISKPPPAPPPVAGTLEIREGFTLVKTLDEFRAAIKKDGQNIRMKPGVYRAEKTDPPMTVPVRHAEPGKDGRLPQNRQEHIFAVNGSNNYFDLRGVVFETPVSIQGKLSGRAGQGVRLQHHVPRQALDVSGSC